MNIRICLKILFFVCVCVYVWLKSDVMGKALEINLFITESGSETMNNESKTGKEADLNM